LIVSAIAVSADTLEESDAKPKRAAVNRVPVKVIGKPYTVKPVMVPKGDPRAHAPGRAPAPQSAAPSSAPIAAATSVPPVQPTTSATPQKAILQATATVNQGACLAGFNGAKLASTASSWQQHYAANKVTYSQPLRQYGYNAKKADCSSFVTSVLESIGYDCLFADGRNTGAMKPKMVARGGFHQVPKLGDIVMWGGHTGIVVQICAGGKAAMVAMGNSGCRNTGCITVASMKQWGSGGWLGFWTPRA